MKKKTISGHVDDVYSLDHNNRTKVAKNVDVQRTPNNYNLVIERQNAASIEEIYEKVFEPDWRNFQKKQRKCRRDERSYLDMIREKRAEENLRIQKSVNKRERHKTANDAYEIVFEIGDMDNTGYENAPEDAAKAEKLLREFMDEILKDPQVCVVTKENLADPEWKPPFDNGLILYNFVGHFDEKAPGVHLTFIPYTRTCERGSVSQNSKAAAFEGMGYPVVWEEIRDENGEKVPKKDRFGRIRTDKDGNVLYQKEMVKRGAVDWIETKKEWLQQRMLEEYGWYREYKGRNPRGNLSIPDYQVARAKERIEEAKHEIAALNFQKDQAESATRVAVARETIANQRVQQSFSRLRKVELSCEETIEAAEEQVRIVKKDADAAEIDAAERIAEARADRAAADQVILEQEMRVKNAEKQAQERLDQLQQEVDAECERIVSEATQKAIAALNRSLNVGNQLDNIVENEPYRGIFAVLKIWEQSFPDIFQKFIDTCKEWMHRHLESVKRDAQENVRTGLDALIGAANRQKKENSERSYNQHHGRSRGR